MAVWVMAMLNGITPKGSDDHHLTTDATRYGRLSGGFFYGRICPLAGAYQQ